MVDADQIQRLQPCPVGQDASAQTSRLKANPDDLLPIGHRSEHSQTIPSIAWFEPALLEVDMRVKSHFRLER
ncbi:hypothetical protein GCM10007908_07040 [Rhizobium albus]|nr:hypothetical protein GCM10007908_07040 [Rhizobium albus]